MEYTPNTFDACKNSQEWRSLFNSFMSSPPSEAMFQRTQHGKSIPIQVMLEKLSSVFGDASINIEVTETQAHLLESKSNTTTTPTVVVALSILDTGYLNEHGRERWVKRSGVGGTASSGKDAAYAGAYSNAITNALEKFKAFGLGLKKEGQIDLGAVEETEVELSILKVKSKQELNDILASDKAEKLSKSAKIERAIQTVDSYFAAIDNALGADTKEAFKEVIKGVPTHLKTAELVEYFKTLP